MRQVFQNYDGDNGNKKQKSGDIASALQEHTEE